MTSGIVAALTDRVLALHGWAAVAIVFAVPALEASTFVGFLFPGELAVLLGGVLAAQDKVPLAAVLVAAAVGAITGDTVGYEIGRRHGRAMLDGTLGRFVSARHLDRAEAYLAERGGRAVFVGRFTAAFRVLIPGLAGMSGLRYRTFAAYNAAGGTLWAIGFVLAGYLAGDNWRHVAHVAGRASALLVLVVVAGLLLSAAARWAIRNQHRIEAAAARLRASRVVTRLEQRYDRQLAFLGRRLRPGGVTGLSLSIGLAGLVAAGWAFGAVTQDVIAGDEAARLDRPVGDWLAGHREPWLTTVARGLTQLGSSAVLVPLLAVAAVACFRARRRAVDVGYLASGWIGAQLLFRLVKALAARPRPGPAIATAHFSGYAFPSGHATQAAAVYGTILVLALPALRTWQRQVAATAAAIVLVALVGATRLYLGAHWLTDVVAGWTLGGAWLAVITIVWSTASSTPRTRVHS